MQQNSKKKQYHFKFKLFTVVTNCWCFRLLADVLIVFLWQKKTRKNHHKHHKPDVMENYYKRFKFRTLETIITVLEIKLDSTYHSGLSDSQNPPAQCNFHLPRTEDASPPKNYDYKPYVLLSRNHGGSACYFMLNLLVTKRLLRIEDRFDTTNFSTFQWF